MGAGCPLLSVGWFLLASITYPYCSIEFPVSLLNHVFFLNGEMGDTNSRRSIANSIAPESNDDVFCCTLVSCTSLTRRRVLQRACMGNTAKRPYVRYRVRCKRREGSSLGFEPGTHGLGCIHTTNCTTGGYSKQYVLHTRVMKSVVSS